MRCVPDKFRLPHGPYTPLSLHKGDRATCLYRDADVVITRWSDGRLSWPRCRVVDCPRGGSGLLVDAELARAVRTEAALAVAYGWGTREETVTLWRHARGVESL
jgi:hypothetical protein